MQKSKGNGYSRRQFGQVVLAGLPVGLLSARGDTTPPASGASRDGLGLVRPSPAGGLLQRIDSRVAGVQLGVQTYSFRKLRSLDDIIKGMVTVGLGEVELMYDQAETAL